MTIDEKRSVWEYIIGLSQIEGFWKPSKEYIDLVEKEINGEITASEMKRILIEKYSRKE